MNIQELHEKKKAFEMKLVEIIGKELSEFANEGVTITSIDVDFENVWPANIINPIIVPVQIPMITRSKPMTVNITDNLVTILSGIRCISIISILPILWCISFIEPFV